MINFIYKMHSYYYMLLLLIFQRESMTIDKQAHQSNASFVIYKFKKEYLWT